MALFPPKNRSNKMIGNGILKVYKIIRNDSLHNLCDNFLLVGMTPTEALRNKEILDFYMHAIGMELNTLKSSISFNGILRPK